MFNARHTSKWLWRTLAATLILSLVSIAIPSFHLAAEPIRSRSTDTLIVWDTSYSMRKTDSNQTIAVSIPVLIDLHDRERFRLGVITYNHLAKDTVLFSSSLSTMNKENLEQQLRGVSYRGYSDLGLGLKRGVNQLSGLKNQFQKNSSNRYMIVISDGNIDLPTSGQRQLSDALHDIQLAVAQAKEKHIPIYTITIAQNGNAKKQLEQAASSTNGRAFQAHTVDELPKLLAQIAATEQQTYGMLASLTTPYTTITEQIPTTWTAQLLHANKEVVTDKRIYEDLQAELIITNKRSNESRTIPLKLDNNSWAASVIFEETGRHILQLKVKGLEFNSTYKKELDVTALQPTSSYVGAITSMKEHGSIEHDITSYFKHATSENNQYYLLPALPAAEHSRALGKTALNNGKLSFIPQATGSYPLHIVAVSENGQLAKLQLDVHIDNIWTRYGLTIVGVLTLAAAALGLWLWLHNRARQPFTGRIEMCFLSTASGAKYPVKVWPLAAFNNHTRIDLHQLFMRLDTNEPIPETSRIFFESGRNGQLHFIHQTNCRVVFGMRTIPAHTKIALNANDRIYITFEDGKTEVELSYKSKGVNSASRSFTAPAAG
ncbi:vWA domain-containing protein [Paenibacillus arenosi]|uniref:VWA domain-containing protein n=1 Tax=Paenibacillus arenosi TaxID=2774142 RepID=A0ABR9AXF5_9BACL|nr:vWA domain-containing protein [Paenibacillus arenosi]MBD8498812.1 VWA domain-containing protein [Paenibacillus arenosi]